MSLSKTATRPGAVPVAFPALIQETVRRLCPEATQPMPPWLAFPRNRQEGRRLTAWMRETHDLALARVAGTLDDAVGSSAQLLLLETAQGWHLLDCREGAAALWDGKAGGLTHASQIDRRSVTRILSVRPAQDVSPRNATRPERQPGMLPFLREYRGRLLELAAAGVVINAVAMSLPIFTSLVYDKVVGNGVTETLWALAIGMVLFVALDLLLKAVRTHTVETVACRMDARAEQRLMQSLLDQHGPMPPLSLMLARYRDLVSAREFLSSNWLMTLADAPFVAVYLVVVAMVGGPVALVPLGVGAAMMLWQWLLHKPAHRYVDVTSRAMQRKVSVLAEVLAAGEVARVTHLRYALGRRFARLAEMSSLSQARGRFWSQLGHHIASTAVTVNAVGILVVGVYRIEARELTVGGLVACSMLGSRALSMLAGLTLMSARWSELRIASAKLQALLGESTGATASGAAAAGATGTDDAGPIALPAPDVDAPGSEGPIAPAIAAPWQAADESLSLREVRYEHDSRRPLIDNLSLDVPKGQFVVVLGKPGAGKSTLLKLFGGVVRPMRGDVTLGGHSIADLPPQVRACRIAIKPQDAILFEGTLAENVVAGAELDVTPETLHRAMAVTGIDRWIAGGEVALSQKLLPGGVNLSGGQRQVVALTRALAIDAPVVLLDEPTAGLDQASEQGIVTRLRQWAQGRTVIVATHSMAVVGVADRLIVLDRGRVVADGAPSRVLAPQPAPASVAVAAQPTDAGIGIAGPAAGAALPQGVAARSPAALAAARLQRDPPAIRQPA